MMMVRTEQIQERRAVKGLSLAMVMTVTMVMVRRTRRAERKGPGRGKEQTMAGGKKW